MGLSRHTCNGSDLVYFEEVVVLARQYKSAALESQKLGSNGSCQVHFVQSQPQPSHFPDDLVAEKKIHRRANEYIQKSTPILVSLKGRVTS